MLVLTAWFTATAQEIPTQKIEIKGLPSGEASVGLKVHGCRAVSVESNGEKLVSRDGIFVSEVAGDISADATVNVEVPVACKRVHLSELKTDQLSQDEAPLPPAAKAEPGDANEAPRSDGQAQPLKSQALRQGATISIPGRVRQNSGNSTVDSALSKSGNVLRRDRINNNVGTNVNIERRGGTVIRRNNTIESDNDMVRNQDGTKAGGGSSSTPAYAGHSHIQSGNKLSTSTIVDFGNQDTETEIMGNIGGRVNISDHLNNAVEETTHLRNAQQPVENHSHTTVNNTTNVVRQPQLYYGYYTDAFGRNWFGYYTR